MKDLVKKILPDSIIRYITGLFYGWKGDFNSWEEAEKKCTGYNSEIIFEKVKKAAERVRDGKAAYERDAVLYNEPDYSEPLEKAVNTILNSKKSRLNIIDFGGSLGSTYFQNRANVGDKISNWCIIEQKEFVTEGKENFEDGTLHFYDKVEDCKYKEEVDLLILSSVLQYIREPFLLLNKLLASKPSGVFIDRTPFVKGDDRITIQKVHPKIYKASYPCWFFNEMKFRNYFNKEYSVEFEFEALDKANIKSEFKGFFFLRRNNK